MSKKVSEGDLIQVNEDGPANWFRCILVVGAVEDWGVEAYCTSPRDWGASAHDYFIYLKWHEFDALGVKSKFIVVPAMDAMEGEAK